jgi:hypothetical protein
MTIGELLAKLLAFQELRKVGDYDTEHVHIDADQLLLDYINDQRVTDAFDDLPKWYA